MSNFVERVIAEVKKREILWHKSHEGYKNRQLCDKEWTDIANALNRDKDHIKRKWRNLRDQFQRELRKVTMSPSGEVDNYSGKWIYFESLLFLKDIMLPSVLRKNEDSQRNLKPNETEATSDDEETWGVMVKEEDTETFEDSSGNEYQDAEVVVENVYLEERDTPLEIPLYTNSDSADIQNKKRKIDSRNDPENSFANKRVGVDREEIGNDIDEDMCFMKSLVPFLRKLAPMRKLIVRNEIQSIITRELMCKRCRLNGQRPFCRCFS